MNSEKYIGYLALEIANTMWPFRLCRAAAWRPSLTTEGTGNCRRITQACAFLSPFWRTKGASLCYGLVYKRGNVKNIFLPPPEARV
jgi:hypothetical protein